MIYQVNKTIKKENKKVLLGISPEGNIDNNYNKNYLDVGKITSNNKYIDFNFQYIRIFLLLLQSSVAKKGKYP